MIRVLHIARFTTVPIERRVMLMAAEPDLTFQLVRPPSHEGRYDASAIRRHAPLEQVTTTSIWKQGDPHRGLYATWRFSIDRAHPDIVHAEEEPDSLAALQIARACRRWAPNARLVLNTWQNVDRPKGPAVRWVLNRSLAAADAIVCGNRAASNLLARFGFTGPTPVIPALTLDEMIFSRRTVPRLSERFTIGYVGRLAPEKGIDTLLRATRHLGAPCTVVIAGEGPCRAALESQAASLGPSVDVRFVGPLDPDGVAGLLSAVDVAAVPSRSTAVWQEQFGRVIIEAMGCETPVVASNSGAIPDVVGDAAMLFPEDDDVALGGRLEQLRSNPEERIALGRRGLAWARQEHSPARRAAEGAAFYRSLLASAPRGRRV